MSEEPAIFNGAAMRQHLKLADQLCWRHVDDTLPADLCEAIVFIPEKRGHHAARLAIAYRVAGAWVLATSGEHLPVTHWLPLPEPPKSDEQIAEEFDEFEQCERAAAGITLGEVEQ